MGADRAGDGEYQTCRQAVLGELRDRWISVWDLRSIVPYERPRG